MKIAQVLPKQLMKQAVEDNLMAFISQNGLRRGDKLPAYRELCSRFGVSIVTVQRAMNELARKGVIQLIHGKGGYVAHELERTARKLTRIGLVYHGSRYGMLLHPYLVQILQGFLVNADAWKVDITWFSVHAAAGKLPPQEVTENVDGVIMLGAQSDAYLEQFVREHVPMVVVDHMAPAFALDFVVCDNEGAAELVVDHLGELGHRHIGYCQAGAPEDWDARERYDAFVKRAGLRGIRVSTLGFDELEAVMQGLPPGAPTALVAKDSFSARMILQKLDAAGLSVPAQVSVATIISAAGDEYAGNHRISGGRVDFIAMGEKSTRILSERSQSSRPLRQRIHRIPATFFLGTTTSASRLA